jgi:three-Cys-motif partner protein
VSNEFQFDQIGYWSEIKLDILEKYAKAYSTILASRRNPSLYHVYIDAFAGAGVHLSRTDQQVIPGSPLNALKVRPPFQEYHLIDIKPKKVENLRKLIGDRRDVSIYEGDCNQILLEKVFPRVRYEDYRRALCILDPYGLDLEWNVISRAGQMKTIDLFLNFPVADMNRNVLWRDPEGVSSTQAARMTAFGVMNLGETSPIRRHAIYSDFPRKSPTTLWLRRSARGFGGSQASKGFQIPCL